MFTQCHILQEKSSHGDVPSRGVWVCLGEGWHVCQVPLGPLKVKFSLFTLTRLSLNTAPPSAWGLRGHVSPTWGSSPAWKLGDTSLPAVSGTRVGGAGVPVAE